MEFLAQNLNFLLEERGMNAHDLSRITGIPQPSIFRIMSGQTKSPSIPRLKILATYFDVDYVDFTEKDLSALPYTPKVPSEEKYTIIDYYTVQGDCGQGQFNDYVEVRGGVAFDKSTLELLGVKEERAAIIRATGSSMFPTISDGAIVLLDTSKTEPEENKVFAIQRAGNGLVIKRLRINENGGWYYHSDNSDKNLYANMFPLDEDRIIGRVMWQASSGGL